MGGKILRKGHLPRALQHLALLLCHEGKQVGVQENLGHICGVKCTPHFLHRRLDRCLHLNRTRMDWTQVVPGGQWPFSTHSQQPLPDGHFQVLYFRHKKREDPVIRPNQPSVKPFPTCSQRPVPASRSTVLPYYALSRHFTQTDKGSHRSSRPLLLLKHCSTKADRERRTVTLFLKSGLRGM